MTGFPDCHGEACRFIEHEVLDTRAERFTLRETGVSPREGQINDQSSAMGTTYAVGVRAAFGEEIEKGCSDDCKCTQTEPYGEWTSPVVIKYVLPVVFQRLGRTVEALINGKVKFKMRAAPGLCYGDSAKSRHAYLLESELDLGDVCFDDDFEQVKPT